jgi:methionyl-tRNA formyltransferase
MRKVKVAAYVAGEKGRAFLDSLLDDASAEVSQVRSYAQPGTVDDSLSAIRAMCMSHGIELVVDKHGSRPAPAEAELVFVVGWQFLLPPDARMVVFHDSLLPRFRGFAPTVAALIAGEPEIGVTALRPVPEPDAGPILAQHSQPVDYPAKVRDVLERLVDSYVACSRDVLRAHAEGTLVEMPQDSTQATYSIWRDDTDYLIDWSDSATRICRTIDALGWPYPGAKTILGATTLTVLNAKPGPHLRFEQVHPGKVWSLVDGLPTVVCGEGTVVLTDVRDEQGLVYRFDRLRVRLG